jgi:endonuclease-3 related protein
MSSDESSQLNNAELIRDVYGILLSEYGGQGWWPVTEIPGGEPLYNGGPRDDSGRFEVAVGALLTQNTSWRNASKAVMSLSSAGMLDPETLANADRGEVEALIRSCGYFRQKARRLSFLASYFASLDGDPDREALLGLEGIGPETADSILLYGFGKAFFVVDAYTKRLFSRLGVIKGDERYDRIRGLFESALEGNPKIFNEYHALVVAHCKSRCRRVPDCASCPLSNRCPSNGGGRGIKNNY